MAVIVVVVRVAVKEMVLVNSIAILIITVGRLLNLFGN
jgi:hypothetical protein